MAPGAPRPFNWQQQRVLLPVGLWNLVFETHEASVCLRALEPAASSHGDRTFIHSISVYCSSAKYGGPEGHLTTTPGVNRDTTTQHKTQWQLATTQQIKPYNKSRYTTNQTNTTDQTTQWQFTKKQQIRKHSNKVTNTQYNSEITDNSLRTQQQIDLSLCVSNWNRTVCVWVTKAAVLLSPSVWCTLHGSAFNLILLLLLACHSKAVLSDPGQQNTHKYLYLIILSRVNKIKFEETFVESMFVCRVLSCVFAVQVRCLFPTRPSTSQTFARSRPGWASGWVTATWAELSRA